LPARAPGAAPGGGRMKSADDAYVWPERGDGEPERFVEEGWFAVFGHADGADVAAAGDHCRVERGGDAWPPADDELVAVDGDAEPPPPLEQRHGYHHAVVAAVDENDACLGRQPVVVPVRGREQRRAGGVVVAVVRVLPVRPRETGLAGEHESVRVGAEEGS